MARYTADDVATLMDNSDIESDESVIDEDPDFPLPVVNSEDEEDSLASPNITPRGGI